ncbi:MAG: hypothetical protein M0Z54_15430 [Thermaerobacter sp.]|nr:hypothetical protein [Thermaerobacter sp.]
MLQQAETDNRVLGRVRVAWRMLTSTGLLVGTVADGLSVGLIGYREVLALAVGICLVVLATLWTGSPRLAGGDR